jgi:hypothetical protein
MALQTADLLVVKESNEVTFYYRQVTRGNIKVTFLTVLRSIGGAPTKNFPRQFNMFIRMSAGHSVLAHSLLYA